MHLSPVTHTVAEPYTMATGLAGSMKGMAVGRSSRAGAFKPARVGRSSTVRVVATSATEVSQAG